MVNDKTNCLADDSKVGHYRIVSKIGAGGMGEVYLAEDSRLRRRIALKVLPENIAGDKDRLRRFEQEAFAASALNHPNILTIHEFGAENGIHFLASEFVEGETLRDRLSGGEAINFSEALDIVQQTAFALSAAHAAGIIHRDIKPENIMLRRDGIVKVLDFGLAKLSEPPAVAGGFNIGNSGNKNYPSATAGGSDNSEAETRALVKTNPGVVMGTVSYMSPEQARGKETDARTDLWSLGVVLYEMIARRLPFAGETMNDAIAAILTKEPPSLAQSAGDVPAELQRIARKALTKERDERYQTARDLMIDLKTLRRELDLRDEIERSTAPHASDARGISTSENAPTQTFAAAENTGQTANDSLSTKESAKTTSSAEYIAAEIKQHKLGFVVGSAILLLAFIGFGYWFFANRSADVAQIESIAVLPFVNQSGNAENEYLSDGMTETLISNLSQLPNLSVKARSSVFRYKGKETNSQQIGRELNVQAVLNGRVVQRGQDLTLYIELVNAATEKVLWSEQYNRKQADLISLQTEIARDVSGKLKTKLSGADEQKLAKNYTQNTEAYQLYLKGRYYWNKRTGADVKKSVDYFEQAIDKDPSYALAYAALADAYILIPNYTGGSPHDAYPKARAAATKALEIDETLAEAHSALATVHEEYDWNFPEAEKEFKRAIELNPNYATAHQWYAEYLLTMGRDEESITEMKRAQELDPLSLIINAVLGYTYLESRQYDKATEQLRKTIEMDQNFPRSHLYLSLVYQRQGKFEEAISEVEKLSVLEGTLPEQAAKETAETRAAYKKFGVNGYWRKQIEFFEKNRGLQPNNTAPLSVVASIYARLGEKDKAFALLNEAYEKREADVTYLTSPIYDPIRSDPRFQDLRRRIGLP